MSSPFEESLHGAWPELTYKTFDNDDNVIADVDVDDSLKCFSSSSNVEVTDAGLDEDLFSIYIDVNKLEEKENNAGLDNDICQNGGGFVSGSGSGDDGGRGRRKRKEKSNNAIQTQPRKQRQRRAKKGCLVNETRFVEPRKAMAPEELAELWATDPKRAKRIVANRHSAARSKEREAQCILNLEEKAKKLNLEVTLLNTRLTTNQRDTTKLAAENSELKCQLQTNESQAEQTDGLLLSYINNTSSHCSIISSSNCSTRTGNRTAEICHTGNGLLLPYVPISVFAVYSTNVNPTKATAASRFPNQHVISLFASGKSTASHLTSIDTADDLQTLSQSLINPIAFLPLQEVQPC
ncbi:hypothetical protein ACH5RR_020546 [Cinchona calisaya]|uniref:BZIP domain-containing protein n=1 Tax=Cinchona calisaya TaxID=153742 RepID=A0ABD2ZHR1_9GENT